MMLNQPIDFVHEDEPPRFLRLAAAMLPPLAGGGLLLARDYLAADWILGGFIAAQLYETLRNDLSDFDAEIAAGRFGGLFEWLRQNVHGVGASLSAQQLIAQATGKPLTAAPWLRYAEGKYLGDGG